MNKKKKIILFSLISIFVLLISFIGVFAYYEYYGQYASILNIDGTIKLDAFDVLYPTLKDDKDGNNNKTYGCTPENPYVIDNVTRLRNLIRLNNSGKLEKSKEKYNVDKYYFCLQFDAQEVPQILNLLEEGEFSSLGNNEYPFVDELSGIVYGVEYSTGYIAYYSGCLPIYKVEDGKVFVNGIETNLDPANYSSLTEGEEYICTNSKYDATKITAQTICFDNTWEEQFILVSGTTIIHQVIANETIVATDNQVDIGFVSNIGDGGYIHDLVLYNETITAKEEGLFDAFLADLSALFNGHPRVKTDTLEERHIGLFAGHMSAGANAKNISLAGNNTINIDTERVNYFSNYTTVGYIEDDALIGGKLFSIIATDSMLDGNIQGVLFADEIYQAELEDTNSGATTDYDGATHYKLVDKTANGGWPGTEGTEFKYGSFTFLLSNSNDTVSSIWSNSSSLTLLGEAGYKINGSVLYCADEYRYQANNGINQSSASVKESAYNGITKLENSGNVIDQGKYIIVAHVDDYYYSLKIAATEDSSGNVTYYFDTTDKINVTDFLTTTGTLYQSSLWEVETPSSTPKLKNCRFEDEYFKGSTSSNALNATNNLTSVSLATEFSFNLSDSKMYFTDSGSRYYLNFNSNENKFYFSEDANTDIEIYKISDGYNLNAIKQYSEITDLASYLIIATDGTNNYLVGLEYDTTTQTITTDLQATAASNISSLASGITNSTVTMTVEEYEAYKNFIWRANKNGNNTVSFIDIMSSSLYLSRNGANIIASNTELNWTYGTQNNTTILSYLLNGGYYLTYNNGIATTQSQNYRVYLLEITPQDDTPPYITYDGARYLDATASTIECGDYVLVADYNSNKYAIGMDSNGVVSSPVDVNNFNLSDTEYIFSISNGDEATTSSLVLSNQNIVVGTTTIPITITETITDNTSRTQAITSGETSFTTLTASDIISAISGYDSSTCTNLTYNVTLTTALSNPTSTRSYVGLTYNNTLLAVSSSRVRNGNSANVSFDCTNYLGTNITCKSSSSSTTNLTDNNARTTNSVTYTISYSYLYSYPSSETIDIYGCLSGTNGTLSVSSNEFTWYYDAINLYVYCYVNDDKYYLNYGSSGAYLSTSYDTHVSLYQYQTQYTYENVTRITSGISDFRNTNYYYFASTNDLTNTTNASYLLGKNDPENATFTESIAYDGNTPYRSYLSNIDYYSMQNNYTYDSTSRSITSTTDLSNYIWRFDSGNTRTDYSSLILYGYEKYKVDNQISNSYHYYIGVSNIGGNRYLTLVREVQDNTMYGTAQNNQWSQGNYRYAITGFWNGTITYNNSNYYALIFRGGSAAYYWVKGDTANSSAIYTVSNGSNNTSTTVSSNIQMYYYYATNIYTSNILTLVSSNGDTLEENIHYAIAAENGYVEADVTVGEAISPYTYYTLSGGVYTLASGNFSSGVTYYVKSYSAMTYDTDVASNGIFGTDMTSQINLFKSSGGIYTLTTTLPSNCDWVQVSNNFELRFRHYNSSTTSQFNYLDGQGTNGISSYTSNQSYTNARTYYYDMVNKILSYSYNSTIYYVTYSNNIFGSSISKNDAATIILVRYTPSYKIERVTSLSASLDSGQYMVAGHSVNGYNTIGTTDQLIFDNITSSMTAEISESTYVQIRNYIFNQVYYDNIEGSSYTTDQGAGYVNFLFENDATYGSFISYTNGFELYSSGAKWRLYLENGLWKMVCNEKIGTGSALAYGVNFSSSNTTSALKVVSTVEANGGYVSGQNTASSTDASAVQVAIYLENNYDNAVTSLTTGNYIIFVKVGTYWYMLYLNSTNLAAVQIGKNLNNLEEKVTSAGVSNFVVTSTLGPSDSNMNYGYYLCYNSSYYLYCDTSNNATTLGVTTSKNTSLTNQTMHWKYSYNATYPNQSYLHTVYQAEINNYLGTSGSKVTTDGTATYLYTVNYDGVSTYSLGSIATSITTGNRYALVIFNDGYYYTVSREGLTSTNITYISYGSGLPTTLKEYEVFNGYVVVNNSQYSFTQTFNGNTSYLIIDTDKSLTLSTNRGSCYFSYSGTNPNATPNMPSMVNANNSTYSWYLFRVSKNDDLDNSTDVTVTLSGHIKASASLSVIQSDNYIIVAESNGVYYAMSFTDNETIVPIDVTKTMEEALDGANIRLYSASVFEQLGSEYSLIFNSNAFSGSFYYLLDGSSNDRNGNSPIVDPVSLYDSSDTYYTLTVTTYTGSLSQAQIEDDNYFYFVSGFYIKETTYNPSKVYYTLTETLFTGSEFEEGVSYYKKKTTGGYEKAYEFKDNVDFYTESGGVYTLEVGLTSFDSLTTYYVMTSNPTYIEVNSKTTNISAQDDKYIWTIYTFSDSGNTGYVIGWYSSDLDNTSYLYFNSTNNQFELTTNMSTAYQANSLVQIYRLGEEVTTSETFKTFNVYLEQDGVTILSFPLNEIKDVNDIETYDSTNANAVAQENGTTMDVIPGEYLIATKENDHYYALTLDSSYDLSYADITLVFDGNLIKDENGYYCVSVNTKYLWNQVVAKNSLTINGDTISGLQFENAGYSSQKISYNSVYSLQFELLDSETGRGRISLEYNSTRYYLSFAAGTGYSFVTGSANACDIYIYSVGATAKADSNDSVLSYTYYSTNLDQINYSYFEFNKYLMEELPNYTNVFGGYEYTTGWYLSSNNLLTEVNSSVYFVSSASYNAADFVECSYDYDYDNGTTITPLTLSYYAPKGTASFAITDSDVSEDDAVYVSVIVSTELADYTNADIARYLSLWKVGTFTESTGVANDLEYASDYATTLMGMFKTPTMAIPLANHYDTTTGNTSKSLVKVSGENKYLSTYNYDHLIAHTFKITEPGIYYLGTTSGTVAFSYLSIDKMKDVDEGADSSQNISEDFTIDYAWGTIGNSSNFSQINTTAQSATLDNAIGSVAYIGRTGSEDTTWVHSNIYPEVINGTPGVWTPDTSTTYYTIEAEEVEAHIQTFNDEATYYTKSGSNYVAAGAITSFAATTSYYVYDADKYVLVHIGSNDSFYYIAQADESLYFKKATSNTRASKFYLLSETLYTSLSSFSLHTSYFVNEDNDYKLVYNPTDYLDMEVLRTYAAGVSTVNIDYSTYDNIYFYGYGVMYLNVNKASNRDTRTVNPNYTEKQD